jgi:murein DD-endopeptidase MepM/ murein hydrolase activator NlpD
VIEQKLQIGRQLQQKLGLSSAQAAGVLGNFVRESNLNPRINEGGAVGLPARRGGYGLAQWTGSRQNDLIRFAGSPEQAGDLGTQIAFLKHELHGPERKAYDSLLKAQTPEEAALVFERDFERAGIKANDQRVAAARKAFEVLEQGDAPGGSALVATAGATPSAPGAFPSAEDWSPQGADPLRLAGQALEGSPLPRNQANPLADVALAAVGSGQRSRFAGSPAYRQDLAGAVQPMEGIQQRALGDGGYGELMDAATAALTPAPAGAALQPSMATAGGGGMPAITGGGPIGVGRIADPSEDVFPTTGAHLDVRILTPDGQYIDPTTAPDTLQHLRIGGKPLFAQQNGSWLPTRTLTSGFGPRRAPTAGASTMHRGADFAVDSRTPLEWTGGGQYSFEGGIGRIRLADGRTVKLLHTRPS